MRTCFQITRRAGFPFVIGAATPQKRKSAVIASRSDAKERLTKVIQNLFKETKHFQFACSSWEELVAGVLDLVREELRRPPALAKVHHFPVSRVEITVHPGYKADVRFDQDVNEPLYDKPSHPGGFGAPV